MELTVVTNVTRDDPLMSEEIFGPILPIVTVSGHEEAIEFVNAGEKPLSLYIFSQDKKLQKAIYGETSSGSVCCNDAMVQLSVESLPFGGVGMSGHGNYHGWYSYNTFSHKKVGKLIFYVVKDFMRAFLFSLCWLEVMMLSVAIWVLPGSLLIRRKTQIN